MTIIGIFCGWFGISILLSMGLGAFIRAGRGTNAK
jgi:hypothetical protein